MTVRRFDSQRHHADTAGDFRETGHQLRLNGLGRRDDARRTAHRFRHHQAIMQPVGRRGILAMRQRDEIVNTQHHGQRAAHRRNIGGRVNQIAPGTAGCTRQDFLLPPDAAQLLIAVKSQPLEIPMGAEESKLRRVGPVARNPDGKTRRGAQAAQALQQVPQRILDAAINAIERGRVYAHMDRNLRRLGGVHGFGHG